MDSVLGIHPHWLGLISLWFGLGYLCGSVPFGILVARIFGLGNLREIGSGNIGATNVLRTGSKPAAAATLLLDALKGTLPVLSRPCTWPVLTRQLLPALAPLSGTSCQSG